MKTKNVIIAGLLIGGGLGAYTYFKSKSKNISNSKKEQDSLSSKLSESEASAKALQTVNSPKLTSIYALNHHDVDKMQHYNGLKKVYQLYNKEQVDRLSNIFPKLVLQEESDISFEDKIFLNEVKFIESIKKTLPLEIDNSVVVGKIQAVIGRN